MFKFHSIRRRLLFPFLGFTLIALFIGLLSIWFYDKITKLATITSHVETALTQTLQLIKIEQNFSDDEIFSEEFYIQGKSKDLNAHKKLLRKVKKQLYDILELEGIKQIYTEQKRVTEDIKHIIQELESYESEFEHYINLTLERGFKNQGLEGQMRDKIHQIENLAFGIDKEDVLALRRYEKDYIIRKDTNYVIELEKLYEQIQDNLISNPQLSEDNKKHASELLKKYLIHFKRIVELESLMGINSRLGVRGKMRLYAENASRFMEKLVRDVNDQVFVIEKFQFKIFLFSLIFTILLSIVLSYYISIKITQPISTLSKFIHTSVQKKFADDIPMLEMNRSDEIGILSEDFNLMLKEIQVRLQEVKEKNEDLEQKNAELENINQEIIASQDKLSKANSVKDTFFSIISHDLRTPLNSISGFLQVLQMQADGFSPDEIRTFSEDMQKSIGRLLDLLENLLQWSMSQTGEINFKPNSINLQKIVVENTELYHRTALQKGIFLIADVPSAYFVRADNNMLDFILRNLISNAIKFSKAGAKITVTSEELGAEIKLIIKDEGVGMSKEHLNKLFLPEEHISTLGTNMEKGTGFGLLLCKNFIERNNGKISVDSELGKGTVIEFTLPNAM